jgi:hypothetical protein
MCAYSILQQLVQPVLYYRNEGFELIIKNN